MCPSTSGVEGAHLQDLRTLDIEVALKVFGWVWGEPIWIPVGGVKKRWLMRKVDLGSDHVVAAEGTQDASNWDIMLPHYSSDIAAAWRVVEHMRNAAWSFGCWHPSMISSVPGPIAAFSGSVYPPSYPHGDAFTEGAFYGFGVTMPEAICRAALAAVAAQYRQLEDAE